MNIYNQIWKKIKENDKIIIASHIRADGDCIGCAIGLRETIKATYPKKDVKALYEDVSYLHFLGKCDSCLDEEFKDALVISVDNSNLSRTNDLRIQGAKEIIKIDHHPNKEPFGTNINFVDEDKCACAEMIFDLFLAKRHSSISKLGVEALFTGIVTDSGRFKYPGVTGETMMKVGMMYEMGLDGNKILNYLDEVSLEELRFKGFVLSSMKQTEHGVLYIKIKPEDREKYQVAYDDASNMVNAMAGVEGSPIWVLFNEAKPDEIRCRVRSIGIKINDTCFDFGGGGHENAGGIVVHDYKKVDELLNALDKKLEKFKAENQK